MRCSNQKLVLASVNGVPCAVPSLLLRAVFDGIVAREACAAQCVKSPENEG